MENGIDGIALYRFHGRMATFGAITILWYNSWKRLERLGGKIFFNILVCRSTWKIFQIFGGKPIYLFCRLGNMKLMLSQQRNLGYLQRAFFEMGEEHKFRLAWETIYSCLTTKKPHFWLEYVHSQPTTLFPRNPLLSGLLESWLLLLSVELFQDAYGCSFYLHWKISTLKCPFWQLSCYLYKLRKSCQWLIQKWKILGTNVFVFLY